MMNKAEDEDLKSKISAEVSKIESQISAFKKEELDRKKPEIVSLLTDEIIKRYFYKEGLYEYYTQHNPEISKAKSILNNPSEYSKILK